VIEKVKNFNNVMPLIAQLHNQYILKRHWNKLMKITNE